MSLPLLADLAAGAAACFAWRVSRPIAAAIALAVGASALHAETGIEALRWSSALVGLVGAVELGLAARSTLPSPSLGTGPRAHPRRGWLGVLCIASMAGDGAALLAWRGLGEWVWDVAQLLMSGAVIAVCVWPRRRES